MSSSNPNFGPYRATALWNEAIMLFKTGMPLTGHRHRLHKHKNSFTGSEAVSFLHKCLKTNNLFNSDVTRDQVKQLLRQFMASGLICRAESCLSSNDERFHDSSKYLYKFTPKLELFSPKLPLRNFNARVASGSSQDGSNCCSNTQENVRDRAFGEDSLWLYAILKRIQDFMVPLDSPLAIKTDCIQAKWVSTNANPKWDKLKWNTELPYWILNALHNLLECSINHKTKKTYPKFEIEIFNVIADYFCTLSSPLIIRPLGEMIVNVLLYIDSLNSAFSGKNSSLTSSQQHLLMKISTPRKKERNVLPPNTCFETAFTSDDLVMRIVPQSDIDVVHLKKWHHRSFNSKTSANSAIMRRTASTQLIEELKPARKPLEVKNVNPTEKGFDNKAFAWSPTSGPYSQCENYSYFPNADVSHHPGRYMKSMSSDNLDKVHVYFNHGLNECLDDSAADDSLLDYKYAIETVNQLVKVSQTDSHGQSYCWDDSASYHTALSESDFESEDTNTRVIVDVESWPPSLNKIAVSIFQLILMLLPPSNRAQLKHIMRILRHVPENTVFPELSLKRMIRRLRDSIFKCDVSSNVSTDVVDQLIKFLVFNYEQVFSDLPPETISVIENEISTEKLKASIFCEQVSREEFEEQKVSESTTALGQLLDQLLNDKALSEKERNRHLKAFKDCYPEIYKQKIQKASSKKTILKPFRL